MAQKTDVELIRTTKTTEIGDSGSISVCTDKYSANYGSNLSGFEGSKTYQRMGLDGVISGMTYAIENPIKSCNWTITKLADYTPEELRINEALNDYFFNRNSWDTLLNQILTKVRFGFSSFERVWKPFEYDKQLYMFPKLEQRMQASITEIKPVFENGKEPHIKQSKINGGSVEIPLRDMVMFVLNENGVDLRGKSMLYGAYESWRDKQQYRQLRGIGVARAANGIPYVKCPPGTKKNDSHYKAV